MSQPQTPTKRMSQSAAVVAHALASAPRLPELPQPVSPANATNSNSSSHAVDPNRLPRNIRASFRVCVCVCAHSPVCLSLCVCVCVGHLTLCVNVCLCWVPQLDPVLPEGSSPKGRPPEAGGGPREAVELLNPTFSPGLPPVPAHGVCISTHKSRVHIYIYICILCVLVIVDLLVVMLMEGERTHKESNMNSTIKT